MKIEMLPIFNDPISGGTGGQNLLLPIPCTSTSSTFISQLPPLSVLLMAHVNKEAQNTS